MVLGYNGLTIKSNTVSDLIFCLLLNNTFNLHTFKRMFYAVTKSTHYFLFKQSCQIECNLNTHDVICFLQVYTVLFFFLMFVLFFYLLGLDSFLSECTKSDLGARLGAMLEKTLGLVRNDLFTRNWVQLGQDHTQRGYLNQTFITSYILALVIVRLLESTRSLNISKRRRI